MKTMTFGKVVEVSRGKAVFQLLFLKEDKTRCIVVEEINFTEVEKHLEQGESVLIKLKRKHKPNKGLIVNEGAMEPWYFTHF